VPNDSMRAPECGNRSDASAQALQRQLRDHLRACKRSATHSCSATWDWYSRAEASTHEAGESAKSAARARPTGSAKTSSASTGSSQIGKPAHPTSSSSSAPAAVHRADPQRFHRRAPKSALSPMRLDPPRVAAGGILNPSVVTSAAPCCGPDCRARWPAGGSQRARGHSGRRRCSALKNLTGDRTEMSRDARPGSGVETHGG